MKKNVIQKSLLFIAAVLVLWLCINEAMGNGDFKVFLEASKLTLSGNSPYGKWIEVSKTNHALYYYSPMWTFILAPFTFLPPFIPKFIWLIANIYFVYRVLILLKAYTTHFNFTKKQLNIIAVGTLILTGRFIHYNFAMIQMTLFILWGILESLHQIKKGNNLLGASILALCINIKLLPIVIVPYLLYRGYFKPFLSTLVFLLLFLFIPAIYYGWNFNIMLISDWWQIINPANTEHQIEVNIGRHSLSALIPSLFSDTEANIPFRRNLFSLTHESSIFILNIIKGILIIGTLYFLKWPPFVKAKSQALKLRELSYILLLIPLIFPHQQKYAFALVLPAAYYLVCILVKYYAGKTTRLKAIVIILLISFILMTLTTDGLIGRELNNITQHYKTITWGTLLLIPALIIAENLSLKKSESS